MMIPAGANCIKTCCVIVPAVIWGRLEMLPMQSGYFALSSSGDDNDDDSYPIVKVDQFL